MISSVTKRRQMGDEISLHTDRLVKQRQRGDETSQCLQGAKAFRHRWSTHPKVKTGGASAGLGVHSFYAMLRNLVFLLYEVLEVGE